MILMVACIPFISNDTRVVEASIGTTPTVRYSSALSSTYYDSVEGKTGDSLLEGLASLSLKNHKYYTTYEEIKGGNAYSDRDPNNSSNLIDFYTGWSIPNDWDGGTTWNREHVWAQSLSNGLFGEDGAGADIHHIRPLISSINSGRNNGLFTDTEHCGSIPLSKYYYNGTKVPSHTGDWTGCYSYNQDYWEPRDNEKGDIARILLYVYMHYSKEVSANSSHSKAGSLSITNIVYTSSKTKDAAFDMLLEWNNLDPISSFEKNRNNYCASVTGVRNPFIDHPEYVNAIWGDGTLDGDSSNNPNTGGSDSNDGNNDSTTGGTTTETVTSTYYRRLKAANGITVGSKIIIAAKDYSYAMSTEQKTNNRGQTYVSSYSSGSDTYLTPSYNTQILEVKSKDSSTGGYSLYTGSGYLAATSSDQNLLTTKTSIGSGKNAYWKINFSNESANIVSAGSYTRNTIRYNSTSSLFSCYDADNTQKDVVIYKQYTETTTIVVPTPGTGDSSYEYPESNSLLNIKKAIEVATAAGTSFTANKYQIQGTIESITSTTYGNMTIVDENGDSIYVYGVYSSDGTVRYDSLNPLPQVGDKITLLGVLGVYDSTPEMKSGWIISHEILHTHNVEMTYDENNHFEICNECNEIISQTPHSYTSVVTTPTCTSEGYTTFTCNCGYSYIGDNKEALGHQYNDPSYTWSDDYTKCTASRSCKNDSSHIETETIDSTVTRSESTCGIEGYIVYTASFNNSAFMTQTHTEVIEALTHQYGEPTYTWNEDYSECTAIRVCEHDSSHIEEETVTTLVNKEDALCEKEGSITYTANFINDSFETQIHIEVIKALTHQYQEPTYIWNEDYSECKALIICSLDETHIYEEIVKTKITTVDATCEKKGSITYVAEFKNELFENQTHSEILEMIDHEYDEGSVTKEPSEDEEGEITYTCIHCGHSYCEVVEKLPPSAIEPPFNDNNPVIQKNKSNAVVTTVIAVSSISLVGVLLLVLRFILKLK